MSERLVELRGVDKGYGWGATRVEVLSELDFEVKAGQLLAVVGPSGVGKSTLLHLIGLLDRPDHGRLSIDGRDMAPLSAEERAAVRNRFIGFVFQHHHLLDGSRRLPGPVGAGGLRQLAGRRLRRADGRAGPQRHRGL